MSTQLPFSALVGQQPMQQALILNAIDPRIGGVLIRGERGTAKSTAARALAALLPAQRVVAGCRFRCDPERPTSWCSECRQQYSAENPPVVAVQPTPFVNLPVSATEDRVVGTLDIERAIQHGQRAFEPGVLAAANRGLLYIDEVNLLDDHVVDVLLDSAAMGVNVVEREGISFSHPARFILVGTMNPEEGELRPQLLDRFGLSVEVRGLEERSERIEVMKRTLAFEENPERFSKYWQAQDQTLAQKIQHGRLLVGQVVHTNHHLDHIAQITTALGVDGHRADLVILKTARALAAFHQRTKINFADIAQAAELALAHRLKQAIPAQPDSSQSSTQERLGQVLEKLENEPPEEQEYFQSNDETHLAEDDEGATEVHIKVIRPISIAKEGSGPVLDEPPDSNSATGKFSVGVRYAPRQPKIPLDRATRRSSGRHTRSYTNQRRGRYVRSRAAPGQPDDLAFDATLRAAAPFQRIRLAHRRRVAFAVQPSDYMRKVRISHACNLVLFLVDTSYSMSVSQRMEATRGAIFSLLTDAYQRRDRVGLITFNREKPNLVLPPTNSVDLARKVLADIPVGGKTPLSAGLMLAYKVICRERDRNPGTIPILVVMTDGAANVAMGPRSPEDEAYAIADEIAAAHIHAMVIDMELSGHFEKQAETLASHLKAPCYRIPDLNANQLTSTVQHEISQELPTQASPKPDPESFGEK